jgi:16S rRNA (guanine527-N7)-methyltransferase
VKSGALTALGDRCGLNASQLDQLAAVLCELERDEHAPTTIRDTERAVDLHLADSLTALGLPAVGAASSIADLGAGAGFPGLTLAVALPQAEVRLIESQARKCAFIKRVCAAAAIENASVVCARAEEWREGLGCNDVIVARALASQPVVLEYAAPLMRLGGTLVDWRGRRVRVQEDEGERAAASLGLRRVEIRKATPFEGARDHHLHVFAKVAETPSRFPRRAGMARKRPLGA